MKFKFGELRSTYEEVKKLLEKTSLEKVNGLDTRIAEDLSLWGDDNYYFLIDFVDKYNLNFDGFNYDKHFESEAELFNATTGLLTLIYLPFAIINGLIKLVYPNSKTAFDNLFEPLTSDRDDLTFGDLIASKLKGEFCLRKDLVIEI